MSSQCSCLALFIPKMINSLWFGQYVCIEYMHTLFGLHCSFLCVFGSIFFLYVVFCVSFLFRSNEMLAIRTKLWTRMNTPRHEFLSIVLLYCWMDISGENCTNKRACSTCANTCDTDVPFHLHSYAISKINKETTRPAACKSVKKYK